MAENFLSYRAILAVSYLKYESPLPWIAFTNVILRCFLDRDVDTRLSAYIRFFQVFIERALQKETIDKILCLSFMQE